MQLSRTPCSLQVGVRRQLCKAVVPFLSTATCVTPEVCNCLLLCRSAQPHHVGGNVPGGVMLKSVRAAAAVEAQLAEPASPAPSTTAPQVTTPQQQRSKASRRGNSGRQQQQTEADGSGRNADAIVVADKPVTNAILKRLEAVSRPPSPPPVAHTHAIHISSWACSTPQPRDAVR